MKAIIKKIDNFWVVVIPPIDDSILIEEYKSNPKKFIMPIYKVSKIKNLVENEEVEGNIIRENKKNFFVIKDVCMDTLTLIKKIMNNFTKVAITYEQYVNIHNIAKSENLITSYFKNGFCINYKYLVFGKLVGNNKYIAYPQIKIK